MMTAWDAFVTNINSLELNMGNSLFRLVLSMLLGVIVGAERKRKGQIAGVRTFALISMGACLAMLLSIYVPQEYTQLKNGDPGRIAAQVITGIGFIGGGTIIHMKGSVRGLTTAAGIWMTAIIGMAVGIGMYVCAVGATALIMLILVTFEWYERRLRIGQESKVINIKINGIMEDLSQYRQVFKTHGIHLSNYFVEYDYSHTHTEINFVVLAHSHANLLPVLARLRSVAPTNSITLSSDIDL